MKLNYLIMFIMAFSGNIFAFDDKVILLPNAQALALKINEVAINPNFSEKTNLHFKLANRKISTTSLKLEIDQAIYDYLAYLACIGMPDARINVFSEFISSKRETMVKAIIDIRQPTLEGAIIIPKCKL